MYKANSPIAKNLSEAVFWVSIIFLPLFPCTPRTLAEEVDLEKGKALYETHCAVCHGQEGKGDGYPLLNPPPADLTSAAIQKKSYDELWHEIHDGIPDTAMGMWTVALSDSEITMILAYVRTLGQ